MSQLGRITRTIRIGSSVFAQDQTVSGDAGLVVEPNGGVAAAKAGTLTTRTDNDTGVVTLSTGHGIVTSDKVDVYWSGGARYGMTATVSGNAVTVDGGTGSNLPNQNDAVTVKKPQVETFRCDGSALKGLFCKSSARGRVAWLDELDAEVAAKVLDPATDTESFIWIDGDGGTNPLVGETTVMKVTFSHADSSAAASMVSAAMYN